MRGPTSTAAPAPAPGRTACPSCRASATCCAGATRIAVPGCYPTVSTLALLPPSAPASSTRRRSSWSPCRARRAPARAPKPHLLGAEVMGSASAYAVGGVHRHTPEIEQNLAALTDEPVRVSFTPVLAPMPRGILATVSAPLTSGATAATVRDVYADAYEKEPFVHLLPEGSWPQTKATVGSNAVHIQATVDPRAQRLVAVGRHGQPDQGHRRRRRPVHEPRPRPRRTDRPEHHRGCAVTVTHPAGFTAAGVAAGLKPSGDLDLALIVNHGPSSVVAAVWTSNRCKANPVLWSERVVADGPAPGSSSPTPAAQTATPARPASRSPTRPPRGRPSCSASRAIDVVVCSTGLIGAAERQGRLARRRRRGRQGARPTPAAACRRRDPDHRQRQQAGGRRGRRLVGRRDRQGRGDAGPRPRHHARLPHHRRGRRRAHRRPGAARGDARDVRPARLRRLHVDQRLGRA